MKKHIIDRMNEALFNPSDTTLSEKESEILTRLRAVFTLRLDQPMLTDGEVRDYLINEFKIAKTQAYRDIANVNLCLGNIKAAGKEWQRYRANSIINEAYTAATTGDHRLSKSLVLIANALVKINRLDIDEGEALPWDEIIPQNFEPTSDPTAAGLKPIPDLRQKIEELKRKYIDDISIDIPFEENTDERNEEDIFQ